MEGMGQAKSIQAIHLLQMDPRVTAMAMHMSEIQETGTPTKTQIYIHNL